MKGRRGPRREKCGMLGWSGDDRTRTCVPIRQNGARTSHGAAKSAANLARSAPTDADLATILNAWPTLRDAVRAEILTIIRRWGRNPSRRMNSCTDPTPSRLVSNERTLKLPRSFLACLELRSGVRGDYAKSRRQHARECWRSL